MSAKESKESKVTAEAVKKEKKPRFSMNRKKESEKNGEAKKEEKRPVLAKDPYSVLKYVVMTEKAVRMIETQNKLVFVVDRKSDRTEVARAAEAAFGSKVGRVNVMIDQAGKKKAFIKFAKPGDAGEIAIRLGII